MSANPATEAKTPIDPFVQRIGPWIDLANKLGWPAVILCATFWWAKPHLDDLVHDHRQFLRTTAETQLKQTEILLRIESKADDIRDTVRLRVRAE